eukprot:3678629-Amphidinium_carterae.1
MAVFDMIDANHDGVITRGELAAAAGAPMYEYVEPGAVEYIEYVEPSPVEYIEYVAPSAAY